jgi:hypothetical protein
MMSNNSHGAKKMLATQSPGPTLRRVHTVFLVVFFFRAQKALDVQATSVEYEKQ